jgi:C4-dicarboxylate transporter DctQ subunit
MKLIKSLLWRSSGIFDWLLSLTAATSGVVILFAMVLVVSAILMRYAGDLLFPGVTEVCEYSLLFITFVAAAWVMKIEGHVKMDLLLNRLRPKGQALVNTITSLVSTGTWLIITWYGAKVTWQHYQSGYYLYTELETSSYITLAIIPLGGFILFVQLLRTTFEYWHSLRSK